jgi:hypothetical protein
MEDRERNVRVDAFHCRIQLATSSLARNDLQRNGQTALTDDGVLELARVVDVEELAGAQRKPHAFVILLQLVVDFGRDQSGELSLREILLLV